MHWFLFYILVTARKRSLRRLCFYTCLSFCPQGGVRGCSRGGMRGCSRGDMCGCSGGRAWSSGGTCMVAPGGVHAWLLPGGCAWLLPGVMHGFCWGHGFFWGERGACVGYDEIRSMSGRYASYWNAFLLLIYFKIFCTYLCRSLPNWKTVEFFGDFMFPSGDCFLGARVEDLNQERWLQESLLIGQSVLCYLKSIPHWETITFIKDSN